MWEIEDGSAWMVHGGSTEGAKTAPTLATRPMQGQSWIARIMSISVRVCPAAAAFSRMLQAGLTGFASGWATAFSDSRYRRHATKKSALAVDPSLFAPGKGRHQDVSGRGGSSA